VLANRPWRELQDLGYLIRSEDPHLFITIGFLSI
jgi:hypothetical protein